jgi:hypothetical protein
MRIENKQASIYVTTKQRFVGSNTFSECMENGKYVVYSYGYHFPLYTTSRRNNLGYYARN